VTLDEDLAAKIRKAMRKDNVSFKDALNSALRKGLSPSPPHKPFRQTVFPLGADPALPWDKAAALAGVLEDEEILRKIALRK